MAKTEKLIDKITKLMQKAFSAKEMGSLAEAETFLAKANELMLEHNIEEAQIDLNSGQKTAPKITLNTVSFHDNQSGSRWRLAFLKTLAQFNFCKIVQNTWTSPGSRYVDNHMADVIGKQDNVDTVIYLYHNLSEQLLRMAQIDYKAIDKDDRPSRYGYLKDWLLGANRGFYDKLAKQRSEQEKANNNVTGLVLFNKEAIDKFTTEHYKGGLKTVKSKTVKVNTTIFNKGYAAGQNVSTQKGMGGVSDSKKKLN